MLNDFGLNANGTRRRCVSLGKRSRFREKDRLSPNAKSRPFGVPVQMSDVRTLRCK